VQDELSARCSLPLARRLEATHSELPLSVVSALNDTVAAPTLCDIAAACQGHAVGLVCGPAHVSPHFTSYA